MKKVEREKTLAYAVAFHFRPNQKVDFFLGTKMYQHIQTVYDSREDSRSNNTLEIVYNYSAQKYEVLLVDEKLGSKEIRIL